MRGIKYLLDEYSEVFLDELGTVKPFKVRLMAEEAILPKFC